MSAPSNSRAFTKAAKAKSRPKRPAPFSLRLSTEERNILQEAAGRRSIGAYIRRKLFGDAATKRRERRAPRPDDVALAQALAVLGRSRLASNLNQIAKGINTGTLPVSEELAKELHDACADVRKMREALIESLGLKTDPPSSDNLRRGESDVS
ncbi:MAG: hypothetical protein AAGD92_15240 [Pseudomonadota bacterium]